MNRWPPGDDACESGREKGGDGEHDLFRLCRKLRVGARFCDACGHPVAGRSPAAPDPVTYTPEHIAEKIRPAAR